MFTDKFGCRHCCPPCFLFRCIAGTPVAWVCYLHLSCINLYQSVCINPILLHVSIHLGLAANTTRGMWVPAAGLMEPCAPCRMSVRAVIPRVSPRSCSESGVPAVHDKTSCGQVQVWTWDPLHSTHTVQTRRQKLMANSIVYSDFECFRYGFLALGTLNLSLLGWVLMDTGSPFI